MDGHSFLSNIQWELNSSQPERFMLQLHNEEWKTRRGGIYVYARQMPTRSDITLSKFVSEYVTDVIND